MGSRFANKRDRIEAKIKDLVDLGLLAQKGVTLAQKVKTEIPIYALTKRGLFSCTNVKERENERKIQEHNKSSYY